MMKGEIYNDFKKYYGNQNGDVLVFKARGIIPKSDKNSEEIHILVGTQENTSEIVGNNLEIVE